ncbi:WH2 domain-containing protein [Myroides odoratus]|uniref:WH2 domain-containing protein n=1 Tax=Myroides odoratus TaxID=256 RepID=UPI00397A94CA
MLGTIIVRNRNRLLNQIRQGSKFRLKRTKYNRTHVIEVNNSYKRLIVIYNRNEFLLGLCEYSYRILCRLC